MVAARAATASTALALALCALRGAHAHQRHFPGHPEWDDIWPDPFVLNDLRNQPHGSQDTPPDLSGVWTGSPISSPFARYFLTPSGGGYGSSKDRTFGAEVPAAPGTAYDVRCITGDFHSNGDTPCGWDSARVSLAPSSSLSSAGSARRTKMQVDGAATTNWTATFSFYVDGQVTETFSGPVLGGNAAVGMEAPWNHFTGPLTGLWKGPAGDDFYVVTHDADSGNLTVVWDTSETPVGSWCAAALLCRAVSLGMHWVQACAHAC
jgi:hypothetical protein